MRKAWKPLLGGLSKNIIRPIMSFHNGFSIPHFQTSLDLQMTNSMIFMLFPFLNFHSLISEHPSCIAIKKIRIRLNFFLQSLLQILLNGQTPKVTFRHRLSRIYISNPVFMRISDLWLRKTKQSLQPSLKMWFESHEIHLYSMSLSFCFAQNIYSKTQPSSDF